MLSVLDTGLCLSLPPGCWPVAVGVLLGAVGALLQLVSRCFVLLLGLGLGHGHQAGWQGVLLVSISEPGEGREERWMADTGQEENFTGSDRAPEHCRAPLWRQPRGAREWPAMGAVLLSPALLCERWLWTAGQGPK